jgi:glyoxylase-like metal-dependent hydrolase (beta-lactamase superfamily II)
MQEISEHIYIETSFSGVTLAAINWPHGLILIDSPLRPEDTRSWRSALLNLGGGVDRCLINLDAHPDRTLGTRAMECTVIGHERMAHEFRNRPLSYKAQGSETGADWELHLGVGSIRWAPPDITFTEQLQIHWNNSPMLLEYRPGPSIGSIWAVIPDHKVVFVGDAVLPGQPPFLANADIPAWIQTLEKLASNVYQNYLIVNSRTGLTTQKQVRQQIAFLNQVHAKMEALAGAGGSVEETAHFVPALLREFNFAADRRYQYTSRLKWGLASYFTRHFAPNGEIVDD